MLTHKQEWPEHSARGPGSKHPAPDPPVGGSPGDIPVHFSPHACTCDNFLINGKFHFFWLEKNELKEGIQSNGLCRFKVGFP